MSRRNLTFPDYFFRGAPAREQRGSWGAVHFPQKQDGLISKGSIFSPTSFHLVQKKFARLREKQTEKGLIFFTIYDMMGP